jgi:hypothetical protein
MGSCSLTINHPDHLPETVFGFNGAMAASHFAIVAAACVIVCVRLPSTIFSQ